MQRQSQNRVGKGSCVKIQFKGVVSQSRATERRSDAQASTALSKVGFLLF